MRRVRTVPGFCFLIGGVLIVGVLVTNAINDGIERGRGFQHERDFSHGLKVGLGSIVMAGLLLVIIGIVWIVATRWEARRREGEHVESV